MEDMLEWCIACLSRDRAWLPSGSPHTDIGQEKVAGVSRRQVQCVRRHVGEGPLRSSLLGHCPLGSSLCSLGSGPTSI